MLSIKTMTDEVRLFNNAAAAVLKVGELELEGKIALARGNKQAGLDLLNKAVAAEDATDYAEPADWDLPVREVLGAILLLSGDHANAEKVFRADLERHPRNGRAFFGLAESLRRQGKDAAARMVQGEFERAWQYADTKLTRRVAGRCRGKHCECIVGYSGRSPVLNRHAQDWCSSALCVQRRSVGNSGRLATRLRRFVVFLQSDTAIAGQEVSRLHPGSTRTR